MWLTFNTDDDNHKYYQYSKMMLNLHAELIWKKWIARIEYNRQFTKIWHN